MSGYDTDDEPLALSSHALEALAQFTAERDVQVHRFEKLKMEVDAQHSRDAALTIESFTEDWNESQFWYTQETARLYAGELLRGATSLTNIAVVSTPSVFVEMKNILAEWPEEDRPSVILLEHDERFKVFAEYVHYDYRRPFNLPGHLQGTIDRVICDPPFLNEDCQTKMAMSVRWMTRAAKAARVIISTGERMQPIVLKLYKAFGVRTTTLEPRHARELGNEFLCYASFEGPSWSWVEEEE
ncbi:related to NADH2 dehydrogenase (ubiquinone) 40K chain [Cephalotrichum gorgonifer]|uniref:Protein-lysine N-methyltransferase EFM5 n=1 Tax=Cephalotrichum gorgonifer TaxID=2041049 RepID=A0AAE8SXQ9_9PEZI|nr:related to NADH2 dehydrogenase (ubiquinone) 40K chain [Cephalotrichum gorgonifer]